MRAESHIGPIEWASAALVAVLLHAAVALDLPTTSPSTPTHRAGTPGGSSRVRLALGTAPGPPEAEPASKAAPVAQPLTATPHAPKPPLAARPKPKSKPTPQSVPAPPPSREPEPASEPTAPPVPQAAASASLGTGSGKGAAEHATAPGPVSDAAGAAGEGGAHGDAEAVRGEAWGDYFGGIVQQVTEALEYPRRAHLERIAGTVVLLIRLDRDGELDHISVLESSGSRLLDRNAVRTVRRAAPFGPVPAQASDDELEFDFPVDYALSD